MDGKFKKALAWIGGIGGVLLAVLCGRWRRDLNRKRVSDAENHVADGRRTVAEVRERNSDIEDKADGISESVGRLADTVRGSAVTAEGAGRGIGNARDAIGFGIEILDQAEKRNNHE